MPERSRKKQGPPDLNEIAFRVVSEATGQGEPDHGTFGKNAAAVELGRRGGVKGGKARAANMTPEQRSEAAKRAALARWANKESEGAD